MRRCARSRTSTCGAALKSLVTMSRSPSPSRSKIADERVPSAPSTVIVPGLALARRAALVRARRSRGRTTAIVRPSAARGSTPRTNSASRKRLAAVVQEQRVDAVAEREVHARDAMKMSSPAVGVEVADARSPRASSSRRRSGRRSPRSGRRPGCGRTRCRRCCSCRPAGSASSTASPTSASPARGRSPRSCPSACR